MIPEEIRRITDERLGMKTQALDGSLDDLYPETTWKYILVLVNNKHWIAVKHVKKINSFVMTQMEVKILMVPRLEKPLKI